MSTRSLFRAAASERKAAGSSGIQDPFATYSSTTGALRCSACNYLAIKHENLWASHASSKSHRTNAAKIRAEREAQEQQQRSKQDGKRKATADDDGDDGGDHDGQAGDGEGEAKRAKVDGGDHDETEVDPEWEAFQREMTLAEESAKAPDPAQAQYANATIEVEPVMTGKAATQDVANGHDDAAGQPPAAQEETEAEKRARKEQEEREEIYSRYEEEQRIQDEAEERVSALKLRLERLKASRQAKKQQQTAKSKSDAL